MIDYIRGTIENAEEGSITIEDRSGVGYLLNVSENTLADLMSETEETRVYTYMAVRENDVSLYGFSTVLERKLFFLLLTVPKIGPRIALNVLGAFTPQALVSAILQRDVKLLTIANGVGKKAAEQIVVTLHDKVEKLGEKENMIDAVSDTADETDSDDAALALISLGFDSQTAMRTVRKVARENMALEDIISAALRELNR